MSEPNIGRTGNSFVTISDAFTSEEIDAILALEKDLEFKQAGLGKNRIVNKEVRISELARVPITAASHELYAKIKKLIVEINEKHFGFELFGLTELFQYTVYHGDPNEGGHYTWHRDANPKNADLLRKLTFVLQLSDPSDYKGGDLQLMSKGVEQTVEKKRGLVVAFPASAIHRVRPVTKGTRRSLVLWISGPDFVTPPIEPVVEPSVTPNENPDQPVV